MRLRRHLQFIGRTVLVRDGNVDDAFRILNRIMGQEGLFEIFRRTRYYEKPYQTRIRLNFEKCKAIYNEDMARKVQFVMRKNRLDPWPG
uniref:Mitochondrial ribosomal protein S21 n=1 Tax=Strigamia maritima TaxID=126957 RepID=T1IR17_STRMM